MMYRKKTTEGFTLVELLVSVLIFSMVMLVTTGSLLSLVAANRKAQNLKSVINNLAFALDGMARSMRNGTVYHCGSVGSLTTTRDCASGEPVFAFEAFEGDLDSTSDQHVYRLNGTHIERSLDGGATYAAITAPEVVVDSLTFYAVGTDVTDTIQPKVLMVISGTAGTDDRTQSSFTIQTTVTQRLFDQ